MFPDYGGKCLLHKEVHKWVEKSSQGRSYVTEDEPEGGIDRDNSQKPSMLQVSTHW
jgi:hypothetical protein